MQSDKENTIFLQMIDKFIIVNMRLVMWKMLIIINEVFLYWEIDIGFDNRRFGDKNYYIL